MFGIAGIRVKDVDCAYKTCKLLGNNDGIANDVILGLYEKFKYDIVVGNFGKEDKLLLLQSKYDMVVLLKSGREVRLQELHTNVCKDDGNEYNNSVKVGLLEQVNAVKLLNFQV